MSHTNQEYCRRCENPFEANRQPDKHYPHLCESCVAKAIAELAEAEAKLEKQALDYDLYDRCPEM